MKKIRQLYSKFKDFEYVRESFNDCATVEPNDNAITDAEILSGRLASTFHGTFTKFDDGLNPLHRRGVDFTDLGNIMAAIDSQEEKAASGIAKRRNELSTPETTVEPTTPETTVKEIESTTQATG